MTARLLLLVAASLACGCTREPVPAFAVPEPAGLEALDGPVREQHERLRAAWTARVSAGAGPAARATALGDLGSWFLAYEMPTAAAACLAEAERIEPESGRWPALLGHAERRRGEAEAARAAFERALARDGESRATRVWLAELELEAGRLDAAREHFAAARERDARCARCLLGLGRADLADSRPAAAILHLRAALELQPDATAIHQALGLALRDAGDVDAARRHLQRAAADGRAVRPVPLDDPLLERVASLRQSAREATRAAARSLRAGRLEDALARLRAAAAANPGDATVRLNLCRGELRLGEPGAGLACFDALVTERPRLAPAWHGRGLARALAGDRAGAVADQRSALDLDPGHRAAHLRLADLLRLGGEPAAAAGHYAQALQLEPADAVTRRRLLDARVAAGDWRGALSALQHHGGEPERERLARLLAAAPDASVRDPDRAVALLGPASTVRDAETHALAEAARGRSGPARLRLLELAAAAADADRPEVAARLAGLAELVGRGAFPADPFEGWARAGRLSLPGRESEAAGLSSSTRPGGARSTP